MRKFNDFLNEKKAPQEPVFTKYYIESFLKDYGFKLEKYYTNLEEMYIRVIINGEGKYSRMLDRFISLNYRKIKNVETIKKNKEFKIYISSKFV